MKKAIFSLLLIIALLPSTLTVSFAVDSDSTNIFGSISEYISCYADGLYLPGISVDLISDEVTEIVIASGYTEITVVHDGITMYFDHYVSTEPLLSDTNKTITFTRADEVPVNYCYFQGYHCYYWYQDDEYFLLRYEGTYQSDCLSYCYAVFYSYDDLKGPDISYTVSDSKVTLTLNLDIDGEYTVWYKRSNSDEWKELVTTAKKIVNVTGLLNGMRYDFKMVFDEFETDIVTAVPHADNEIMLSVPEYCQYPDYPTGCESSSLYMLLLYYDVDVTMEEIVEALPKGPAPYEEVNGKLYGADPEKEFVGDPTDGGSYGVYNEPIRETAEQFKSGAISITGATIDDIREILESGNPVIAWFTSNLEVGVEYRRSWYDYETGEFVQWLSYEHAVVVYGISDELVYYNDPITGSGCSLDIETFAEMFELFGCRIVYYME